MRVGIILVVVAAVLAATVGLLWAFQRHLIYLPSGRVPPAASILPGAEEVTFETADGLRLRGWFVPAAKGATRPGAGEPAGPVDNPTPSRPGSVTLPEGAPAPDGAGAARPVAAAGAAVLVCNGNGGNRAMRAALAAGLARMGVAVLLFDYRGYGGNPGRPSEEGLAADARAAAGYLASRPEVDPDRVVYYGESLGAAVALRLATERPPAALVLRSPFASLAEVGRVHYPVLPVSWLLRDRFDAAALAARLEAPLLVVAGGRDRIVPVGHSRRLFAAAPEPKRLVVLDGADHNDLELLAGPRLLAELEAFLGGVPGLLGPAA
jgi:alpha-beta hydrolase superfamily lysophospholipase